MKIQEFIDGRNVSYTAVFQYIKRNEKNFNGHIGKGRNIILDDVAIKLLEEKYPLSAPVQVIQDTTTRDKLQDLHEKYTNILEENNRLTKENANLKLLQHKQLLLEAEIEEKEQLLEESRINVAKIMEERNSLEEEAADQIYRRDEKIRHLEKKDERILERWSESQLEVQELQKQLSIEKSKTWWDKLRGR